MCGGLGGVMESAAQGASESGGLTIGILPGAEISKANPHIAVPVATGLSHMRNFPVVLNSDVVVAVEGEYGTLSEIGLALKSGRPVIALGRWSHLEGVISAASVDEALRLFRKEFSKNGRE